MPKVDYYFKLATSNFKITEAHLRDTEETLYTLKERLEASLERLRVLTPATLPDPLSSDELTCDSQSIESNIAGYAMHKLEVKLEEFFTYLAKIKRDKLAYNSHS